MCSSFGALASSTANSINSVPSAFDRGGNLEIAGINALFFGGQLIEQKQQRSMTVHGDTARRARPELIIENLQRQGTVIASRRQGLHEVEERKVALTREVTKMAAPGEIVHLQQGRVRHLHQKDPVTRDGADSAQVCLAGQDMKGIEHQPDRRMIGAAHRFPSITVVIDVAPPCKRLKGDAQAALGGPLPELMQVGGGAINPADAVRRHVAANHQQVASELLHHIELALGARENTRALGIRHSLEVAERL